MDSEGAVEVFGVGPRSDMGFLSLILQDQVDGLQVIVLVHYSRQCNGGITCLMLIVQSGL
jgi:isopenicillin N synthase-like dioxygenase